MSDSTQMSSPAPGLGVGRVALLLEALAGLAVVGALLGQIYGPLTTVVFTLAAGAVGYTAWMVSGMVGSLSDPTLDVVGRVRDYDREKLEGEKALLLRGIKDLEVDYATGKMEKDDYDRLRASAEARAVAIIRALREADEKWRRAAEALVAERLGAPTPAPEPQLAEEAEAEAEVEAVAATPLAAAALFDDSPVALAPAEGGLVCAACGTTSPEGAHFCVGCGRPAEGVAA